MTNGGEHLPTLLVASCGHSLGEKHLCQSFAHFKMWLCLFLWLGLTKYQFANTSWWHVFSFSSPMKPFPFSFMRVVPYVRDPCPPWGHRGLCRAPHGASGFGFHAWVCAPS